jgi:threonyl-tRNA synthetase
MFEIKLNKNIKKYNDSISGVGLLQEIDKSLRQSCLAIKINNEVKDLSTVINENSEVDFVFSSSPEGLDIIRHDAAHILAQAVKELHPEAMVTIGPVIENGFYYDFANVTPFNEADLEKIEKKMQEIIDQNLAITRKIVTKDEAISFFQAHGEKYKIEIINSFPSDAKITIYTQGNFSDLCKGPHSQNTGVVKAFKLMKIAGAYWRGNSQNEMLQRVYGTAWSDKKQLKQYLTMLEEAEKRDHRKLGRQSDLFHFQEEAQGAVFWHPKGWDLFQRLINYIRNKQNDNGYFEISTPEIMDKNLWVLSGHWEKFRENMFTANSIEEDKVYVVRPMNCPGGVQVYNQGIKSYRDLPLRLAEFGKVHRYEPSGALHGLMRVRAFTQDDAHIFCTTEQMTEECINVCKLIKEIYKDFGFEDVKVKFSDRPEKRIGTDEVWDESEKALLDAVKQQNLPYTLNKGEGAFYGPKLEFVLRDAIGRDWQLGTLQVDFNLPERLDANYIDSDGKKYRPVMLHRALFGSIERFLGILLEHYSGNLPIWLAPIQIAVITVTDELSTYAKNVSEILKKNAIRHIVDLDNEKITYKIRKHSLNKVPIIVVLGKKEEEEKLVSVRKLGDKHQEVLELSHFVDKLLDEIKQKRS